MLIIILNSQLKMDSQDTELNKKIDMLEQEGEKSSKVYSGFKGNASHPH
ncbi:hypothetical protein [Clostridium saccharoperbutylacetonicum]